MAMSDMCTFLESGSGEVAIFDATNTTKARRKFLLENTRERGFRLLFVESICDDPKIVESNIQVRVCTPRLPGRVKTPYYRT